MFSFVIVKEREQRQRLQADSHQHRDNLMNFKRQLQHSTDREAELQKTCTELVALEEKHKLDIQHLSAKLESEVAQNQTLRQSADLVEEYRETISTLQQQLQDTQSDQQQAYENMELLEMQVHELQSELEQSTSDTILPRASSLGGEIAALSRETEHLEKSVGGFIYSGPRHDFSKALEEYAMSLETHINEQRTPALNESHLFQSTLNQTAEEEQTHVTQLKQSDNDSFTVEDVDEANKSVWGLLDRLETGELNASKSPFKNAESQDKPLSKSKVSCWLVELKQELSSQFELHQRELDAIKSQKRELKHKMHALVNAHNEALHKMNTIERENSNLLAQLEESRAATLAVEQEYNQVCDSLKQKQLEALDLKSELEIVQSELESKDLPMSASNSMHHIPPMTPVRDPGMMAVTPYSATKAAEIIQKRNSEIGAYRTTIATLRKQLSSNQLNSQSMLNTPTAALQQLSSESLVDDDLPEEPSQILRMLAKSPGSARRRASVRVSPIKTLIRSRPTTPLMRTRKSRWWMNSASLWTYTLMTWVCGVVAGMWLVGYLVRTGVVRVPHPLAAEWTSVNILDQTIFDHLNIATEEFESMQASDGVLYADHGDSRSDKWDLRDLNVESIWDTVQNMFSNGDHESLQENAVE